MRCEPGSRLGSKCAPSRRPEGLPPHLVSRVTSPFSFLQAEWPAVHEAASKAAAAVYVDPRTACFYARRALELTVAWAYKSDASLHLPYQDNLSALIHEPSFKAARANAWGSR